MKQAFPYFWGMTECKSFNTIITTAFGAIPARGTAGAMENPLSDTEHRRRERRRGGTLPDGENVPRGRHDSGSARWGEPAPNGAEIAEPRETAPFFNRFSADFPRILTRAPLHLPKIFVKIEKVNEKGVFLYVEILICQDL